MSWSRWLRALLSKKPSTTVARVRGRRLKLELLEDRLAPAVHLIFAAGVLTVQLDAANDSATLTGTTAAGSDITVSGTSLAPTPVTGVTDITVLDLGVNAGQLVNFTSAAPNVIKVIG